MNTTKVFANMAAVYNSRRLDGERLRRIVESKTLSDAFKVLGDYGYAYSEGQSVDGFIVGETDRLIEFITENSPSAGLTAALTARFRYNNCKLAYKSRFAPVPDDGFYTVDLDAKRIREGDYSDADARMQDALAELDERQETKPQEIDLALTRAMYKHIFDQKIAIVRKYARAEIDMKNILTVARMKKLGMEGEQFIDGGRISEETLEEALTEEPFESSFEQTPYAEYAERIAADEFAELWRAEREADEHLYYLTYRDVARYTSFMPFLNYYTETLIELKTVKTALVCVKTDSRDMFYKRIPEIYR